MIPDQASAFAARLIADCVFPPAGDACDCAVSGGPDSSALAVLATVAGCHVTLHHVDHGLRAGSGEEADLVAALAEQLGARFVGHRVDVAPGANLEARARDARFAVLPEGVATGHTLDDRAETIVMNLLRGAARSGRSPMPPSTRHPIVRLRRVDTHRLCEMAGLTVLHDPMNNDPRFQRSRVRHELLPLMDAIAQRDVAALLDRQADLLADEDWLLDQLAEAIDATDARMLAGAEPALARRAVRRWLLASGALGHPPSIAAVERVLDVARGHAVGCEVEGGVRITRSMQRLRIDPSSVL